MNTTIENTVNSNQVSVGEATWRCGFASRALTRAVAADSHALVEDLVALAFLSGTASAVVVPSVVVLGDALL